MESMVSEGCLDATKIFLFDEVYPSRAAEEQADKKKLGAFGMLAKLNPLNRPKIDTVLLSRKEMRLEPFWQVAAQRQVEYTSNVDYPVPVNNPHALSVTIGGNTHEVARQGAKAAGRIDLRACEHCFRKIDYATHLDGLGRDIKPSVLAGYIGKYKYAEIASLDRPEVVMPKLPMAAVIQHVRSHLAAEAVNAHEIQSDHDRFERLHLFLRPVYAFEYVWTTADRRGVIEVDGLTGEVVEGGQWFKDKLDRLVTRDSLFDLGADVAGALVPGGSIAVKVIDRITAPGKE